MRSGNTVKYRDCVVFSVFALLCSALCVSAQERKPAMSKDEATLRAMEKARYEAYQKKDVAAIEQQLAEDYTQTFEQGLTLNKADTLEMVRQRGNGRNVEWTANTKARFYGDTAILTGSYFHDIRIPKRRVFEMLYTDTYIKHKGRWYLVATHFSMSYNRDK
jgi:ketosteroid isomerase-like protein